MLLARAEGRREALSQQLTRLGAIVDEAIAFGFTVPGADDAFCRGSFQRFREEGADYDHLCTQFLTPTVQNFTAQPG